MPASITSSPGVVPKDDKPKLDANGNPIVTPTTGAVAPTNTGSVLGTQSPPPPATPAPVAATPPPPTTTLAPEQIAAGANTSLFGPEYFQNKLDVAKLNNATAIEMQGKTLASREPRHLGIGGQPITDANPRGDAGGSPFGSPMRFSTPAERQAKIDANNEGKSALPTREAFMAAPRRQGTVSERTISHNNPYAPNPRTRKGVGETSLADLDRQELSLQWLANNPGIDQHERYMSAPGDTYGAALMAAKRAADPRDVTPIEYPAGQTSPSLPEVDEGQTSTEGSREAMRRLYSGTPYGPTNAFGGSSTPAAKPAAKKKR